MDGIVSPLRREDAVLPPHGLRDDLRRRIADRQGLPHGLEHGAVGEACCQGIDGQHPPGGDGFGLQSLENGVCHIVADEVAADGAVEDILPAVLQLLGGVFIVKESQIQPGCVVGHLDLGDGQALADLIGPGRVHDHSPEAGGHIHLQLLNGNQPGAILISSGEMADQIPQGQNIQLCKGLGLGRTDAFQHRDGIG